MCTVTFVPAKNGVLITSNRDEKHIRKHALPPREYTHANGMIVYPKDADAGGTWVAMKNNGDAAVLLNGGFVKHEARPPYRRSRGLVFLDIVDDEAPVDAFANILLDNIEPFTLITYIEARLFECRWDGENKHIKEISANVPHIWSSVTLYDAATIQKREAWFADWLAAHPQPDVESVLRFHRFGGDGDAHNDIRMSRGSVYCTVSITAMHLTDTAGSMHYYNLINNQSSTRYINIASQAIV